MKNKFLKVLLITSLIISSILIVSCGSNSSNSNSDTSNNDSDNTNSKAENNSANSSTNTQDETYSPVEEREIFDTDKIKAALADTKEYPELAQFIVSDLNMSSDDAKATRYYYDYIDLDDDGTDEIFVELVGPVTSEATGHTAMIFKQTNNTIEKIDTFTLIRNPIIISDQKTNGWRNIIVKNDNNEYAVLKYEADKYTTVNDSETISNLGNVTGTAIITNDISKDAEEGKGLYLEQ